MQSHPESNMAIMSSKIGSTLAVWHDVVRSRDIRGVGSKVFLGTCHFDERILFTLAHKARIVGSNERNRRFCKNMYPTTVITSYQQYGQRAFWDGITQWTRKRKQSAKHLNYELGARRATAFLSNGKDEHETGKHGDYRPNELETEGRCAKGTNGIV